MSGSRWLNDDQQQAWRRLVAVMTVLPGTLDRQLRCDSNLSHFEYWVLALLSEEPNRRLQLRDLAMRGNASPSRLSHVVTRLEGRGLVRREQNPDDARASDAVLTDEGWAVVVAAAPGHAEAVRSSVFDGLDGDDVAALTRICDAVLEQLDMPPRGC